MGMDIESDYERFRTLVSDYVEYMLAYFPRRAKQDWKIDCYQSVSEFETKFPTPESRTELIEKLENEKECIRDAINDCEPIFNTIKGGNLPPRLNQGNPNTTDYHPGHLEVY